MFRISGQAPKSETIDDLHVFLAQLWHRMGHNLARNVLGLRV